MHEPHDATGPVHGVWRNEREFVVATPAWWKNVSTMIGVIIGTGTVVGFIMSRLYVDRTEFTEHLFKDRDRGEEVRSLQREVGRLNNTIERLQIDNENLSQMVGELQRRRR